MAKPIHARKRYSFLQTTRDRTVTLYFHAMFAQE